MSRTIRLILITLAGEMREFVTYVDLTDRLGKTGRLNIWFCW